MPKCSRCPIKTECNMFNAEVRKILKEKGVPETRLCPILITIERVLSKPQEVEESE